MPALNMSTSHARSAERAIVWQQHNLAPLHAQQDDFHRRILGTPPSPPPSPRTSMAASPDMTNSETSSATPSPTLESTLFSQISPPAYALPKPVGRKNSTRSPTVAPIPEDGRRDEYEPPANQLHGSVYDVNHEIKTTLTELLNSAAVRNDGKMRLEIQTRLMDTEMQLKQQRRQRQRQSSSPHTPTVVLSPAEDLSRRVSLP